MKDKLPNFVVVGFPKCGSTSLHYYLNEHPDIFMPRQKELHYFTNKILSSMTGGPGDKEVDKFHVKSFEEYKGFYKDVDSQRAVGDVSPSYINYPSCIIEMKEKLGLNLKIIVLVRDPIKRAFSNYLHLVREERELLDFYSALKMEPKRKKKNYSDFWFYSFNSDYYQKIKMFKEAFQNVLLITTEDMSMSTKETIQSVYRFLDVDDKFMPENVNRKYNEGGVFRKNLVTKFFFRQGKLRSLIKKNIPITPRMKHLKHALINKFHEKAPEIDPIAEKFLIDLFSKDVLKLERDFQINVKLWNPKFLNS